MNQIRISAGKLKGRKLSFLDAKGLRPTLTRHKQMIFNWLMYDIQGAKVLDLFAGAGSLGVEAYSQGASAVDLVELSDDNAKQLMKNTQELKITKDVKVHQQDAFDFIQRSNNPYDIIFIDPPFETGMLDQVLEAFIQMQQDLTNASSNNRAQLLKPDTIVYLEYESKAKQVSAALEKLELHFEILKEKTTSGKIMQLIRPK